MNPVLLKLIEKGADITDETLKYANQMQGQINELNRETLDDHNRKINNLQKQLDFIIEMAMNKDLSYDEKMKLIEKMDELQEKINMVIEEKNKFEQEEKEKVVAEKKKIGQTVLEVATGVIPFTTAYRSIKNKKEKKKNSKKDSLVIENVSDESIEYEDKKRIE